MITIITLANKYNLSMLKKLLVLIGYGLYFLQVSIIVS